jgi:hypothetical protein
MPARYRLAGPCLLGLLGLALLLGACGTQHGAAPALRATATPTQPALVAVQVAVQQSDSIAQRDVALAVAIAVANHTDQPVSLHGSCERPPIVVTLAPADGTMPPTLLTGTPNCIIGTDYDLPPPVVASGSHTFTRRLYPYDSTGIDWPAGSYVLATTITDWHQDGGAYLAGSVDGTEHHRLPLSAEHLHPSWWMTSSLWPHVHHTSYAATLGMTSRAKRSICSTRSGHRGTMNWSARWSTPRAW